MPSVSHRQPRYFDEAEALARRIRQEGLCQKQIAARLGVSQSAVANKLRLLHHTLPVRAALLEAGLSERHARALLRLDGEASRLSAIAEISRRRLSVAATEQYIEQLAGSARRDKAREVHALLAALERACVRARRHGLTVSWQHAETPGEIAVHLRISAPQEGKCNQFLAG